MQILNFLNASVESKSKKKISTIIKKNKNILYENVLNDLKLEIKRYKQKKMSPLVKAKGAMKLIVHFIL